MSGVLGLEYEMITPTSSTQLRQEIETQIRHLLPQGRGDVIRIHLFRSLGACMPQQPADLVHVKRVFLIVQGIDGKRVSGAMESQRKRQSLMLAYCFSVI